MNATPSHPFDQLAESCTRGLESDAQLHAEVCTEIRAHLDDKCTELAEIFPDDPARQIEETLQAWGSPDEINESLTHANLKRMKHHAVLRKIQRYILFLLILAIPFCFLLFTPLLNTGRLAVQKILFDPPQIYPEMLNATPLLHDYEYYAEKYGDFQAQRAWYSTHIVFCALNKSTDSNDLNNTLNTIAWAQSTDSQNGYYHFLNALCYQSDSQRCRTQPYPHVDSLHHAISLALNAPYIQPYLFDYLQYKQKTIYREFTNTSFLKVIVQISFLINLSTHNPLKRLQPYKRE